MQSVMSVVESEVFWPVPWLGQIQDSPQKRRIIRPPFQRSHLHCVPSGNFASGGRTPTPFLSVPLRLTLIVYSRMPANASQASTKTGAPATQSAVLPKRQPCTDFGCALCSQLPASKRAAKINAPLHI